MISIIIPVFNGQEWLCDAIDSAISQIPYAVECIVIDDGSTDKSLEIAQKYKVHNIKVISQVNKGLASARNTGIMWATGEYILPLDADDILLDGCCEKITQIIKENPDVDIIAPSFKEFGIRDREVVLMQNPTIEDFKIANRIGYCAAIKRSALLEIGGYSPRMIWGAEDLHLWYNLLTRGKTVMTIPEILWLYRVKENSMWTETQNHIEEFTKQINKDFPNL
jgi:glycosyltransferase involved in cell wall biosynthesis